MLLSELLCKFVYNSWLVSGNVNRCVICIVNRLNNMLTTETTSRSSCDSEHRLKMHLCDTRKEFVSSCWSRTCPKSAASHYPSQASGWHDMTPAIRHTSKRIRSPMQEFSIPRNWRGCGRRPAYYPESFRRKTLNPEKSGPSRKFCRLRIFSLALGDSLHSIRLAVVFHELHGSKTSKIAGKATLHSRIPNSSPSAYLPKCEHWSSKKRSIEMISSRLTLLTL